MAAEVERECVSVLLEAFDARPLGSEEVVQRLDAVLTRALQEVALPTPSLAPDVKLTVCKSLAEEIRERLGDGMDTGALEHYLKTKALRPWLCLAVVWRGANFPDLTLHRVLQRLHLPPYDAFRSLEKFVSQQMHTANAEEAAKLAQQQGPHDLRGCMNAAECELVTDLLWRDADSAVFRLLDFFNIRFPDTEGGEACSPPTDNVTLAISFFVRRCGFHIVARAKALCDRLHAQPSVVEMVVKLVHHCVMREGKRLLLGRHLDTVLLCAAYVVMTKQHAGFKFVTLVEAYSALFPATVPKVCREVPLNSGTCDVIAFYNQLFRDLVKPCLKRVLAGGIVGREGKAMGEGSAAVPPHTPPRSPAAGSSSPLPPSSPLQLGNHTGFLQAFRMRSPGPLHPSAVRVGKSNLVLRPMRARGPLLSPPPQPSLPRAAGSSHGAGGPQGGGVGSSPQSKRRRLESDSLHHPLHRPTLPQAGGMDVPPSPVKPHAPPRLGPPLDHVPPPGAVLLQSQEEDDEDDGDDEDEEAQ